MKVLYIAGYGRSGSSILSRILGQESGVASLGEIAHAGRFVAEDRECSCGSRLSACPYWAPIVRRARGAADALAAPRPLLELVSREHDAELLIDSSKTAYAEALRPLRYGLTSSRFHLIHLVRRPDQVFASARKGRNKEIEAGGAQPRRFELARTVTGWLFANTAATLYRLLLGRRALVIRYEDLVANPVATLQRIERLVDHSFARSVALGERSEPLSAGHEIAGNRVLRAGGEALRRPAAPASQSDSLGWRVLGVLSRPIGG